MNRAKLKVKLTKLADQIDEIAAILCEDAKRIRAVAASVRTAPISQSRSVLSPISFLDGYFGRNVPEEVLRLRSSFESLIEEDMRPNRDLLTNSTYNKDYW